MGWALSIAKWKWKAPILGPRPSLAAGAYVGAAARCSHLLDRGAAADAWLALAQVDQETVLEGAARAVHVAVVVDGGALGVDSGAERLDHRVAQRLDLGASQRSDGPERVDLRPEQRLVGVDVSHAGHALLVQEERLHRLPASARLVAQGGGGEVGAERLHAEPRGEVLRQGVASEQHVAGPEATDVHEQELLPIVELHAHAGVLRLLVGEQEVSCHPEVHHEVHVVLERHDQVLPAAPKPFHDPAVERIGNRLGRRRIGPARIDHLDVLEPPPLDGGRQLATNRLYLGELRHPPGSSRRAAGASRCPRQSAVARGWALKYTSFSRSLERWV